MKFGEIYAIYLERFKRIGCDELLSQHLAIAQIQEDVRNGAVYP